MNIKKTYALSDETWDGKVHIELKVANSASSSARAW